MPVPPNWARKKAHEDGNLIAPPTKVMKNLALRKDFDFTGSHYHGKMARRQ
ncbi:hypothetical protein LguiB_003444 [Lonicera macranthoides]